jgi:hypothetical protein
MRRIIERLETIGLRQNMDCCGHGHVLTRRRWIWSTLIQASGFALARMCRCGSVAAIVGGD